MFWKKTKSKKEEAKVCTGLSSTLCTPHTTQITQGPPISLTETRTDFSLSHIDFFFLYITGLLVTSIKCLLPIHTEALEVSSTLGVQGCSRTTLGTSTARSSQRWLLWVRAALTSISGGSEASGPRHSSR